MDIKDLAGLSQPLTRLIEVTAEGIGAVKYEEGNVIVESSPTQEILSPSDNSIEHQILMRVADHPAKKQSNLENVVQYATDELKN